MYFLLNFMFCFVHPETIKAVQEKPPKQVRQLLSGNSRWRRNTE